MDKIDLKKFIGNELGAHGFRYKKMWIRARQNITDVVSIYKSNYANKYYFEFGINVNNIKSIDRHYYDIPQQITFEPKEHPHNFLNLEDSLTDEERMNGLRLALNKYVLPFFSQFQNEEDVLKYLKELPHLNMISVYVKEYFKIGFFAPKDDAM